MVITLSVWYTALRATTRLKIQEKNSPAMSKTSLSWPPKFLLIHGRTFFSSSFKHKMWKSWLIIWSVAMMSQCLFFRSHQVESQERCRSIRNFAYTLHKLFSNSTYCSQQTKNWIHKLLKVFRVVSLLGRMFRMKRVGKFSWLDRFLWVMKLEDIPDMYASSRQV